MKSLKTIQKLYQIAKVLSQIAFVCAIIGFCGCILGMITAAFGSSEVLKLGGVTLHSAIEIGGEQTFGVMNATLCGWMLICAGEAVLAWFAKHYFAAELDAGTPFTKAGAKELQRLGILTVCIPLGCAIAAAIVSEIVAGLQNVSLDASLNPVFDEGTSIALGVMFILASLLCSHGAELTEQK